jgi:hypothetical protein
MIATSGTASARSSHSGKHVTQRSGASSNTNLPDVPTNAKATIYTTFGGETGVFADEVPTLNQIGTILTNENYSVTFDSNTTGTATLGDFINMKNSGVVVVDTHGLYESSSAKETVCSGKGVSRIDYVPGAPRTPAYCLVTGSVERKALAVKKDTAYVLVQVLPSYEAAMSTYTRDLAGEDATPDWINLIDLNTTNLHVPGYGLLISAKGIEHYFSGNQIGIFDGDFCHSMYIASDVNAWSFMGYEPATYCGPGDADQLTFWNRLAGNGGISLRSTTAAMDAGMFQESFFQLAPKSRPVFLSPAVTDDFSGGSVVLGQATSESDYEVTEYLPIDFDAEMATSSGSQLHVVSFSSSGCTLQQYSGQWIDRNTFGFLIGLVPLSPPTTYPFYAGTPFSGTVTLTVSAGNGAVAWNPKGATPNDALDGNTLGPNGTVSASGVNSGVNNYSVTVPCSATEYPQIFP